MRIHARHFVSIPSNNIYACEVREPCQPSIARKSTKHISLSSFEFYRINFNVDIALSFFSEKMPFVSSKAANRMLIRAVNLGDHKMLQQLISDHKRVSDVSTAKNVHLFTD